MIHHPVLELQLGNGGGVKKLLGNGVQVRAGFGAGRRHPVGVGGGIGVAEAAGIGGNGNIEPPCDLLGHLAAHDYKQIIDNLPAGCSGRIHQFVGGKGAGAGMVVDPQLHPILQRKPFIGQHPGRRHIYGDNGIAVIAAFLGQSQLAPVQERGGPMVMKQVSGLAQLPQAHTQGRCTAHGIAVGTNMGQNAKIVMFQQPCCALIPRHHGYRRADC